MPWLDSLKALFGRNRGNAEHKSTSADRQSDKVGDAFRRMFSNTPSQSSSSTAAQHIHKPTAGRLNFGISTTTFFIFVYVLVIEGWLISNSVTASQDLSDKAAPSSASVRSSILPIQPTASAAHVTDVSVIWSNVEELDPVAAADQSLPTPSPKTRLKSSRSISKSAPTFRELQVKCLYIKGSRVPTTGGGLAVGITVMYDVWIILFILAVILYEHRRLRFDRCMHSATVVGMLEIWLASSILTRGVEIQLQLAAALLVLAALPNLWYGFPETYRNRKRLLALFSSRTGWPGVQSGPTYPSKPRSAVTIQPVQPSDGTAVPPAAAAAAAPSSSTDQTSAPAAGAAPAAVTVQPTRQEAEIALPEVDLKPADEVPAYVYDRSLLTGLSDEEIKRRFGEIPDAVRKAIPGGVMSYTNRPLTMQEMMYKAMFDTSGGGAGDSARDGKAAGTGGMNLDRMMMMMMMNNMTGGNVFGQAAPQQPGRTMNPFGPLSQQNPYASGGYGPNPYGSAVGRDTALSRLLQREAAKEAGYTGF